jgi:phasin family protein
MAEKQSTPNPLDPLGLMQYFDPTKILEEWNKALSGLSIPGLDTGPLVDTQRKNLEALLAANQALLEGGQQLLRRQTEVLTEVSREAASASTALASGKPEELQQKQGEMINAAYSKAVAVLQETTETIQEAQKRALEALDKRSREAVEELRALVSQGKG